MRPAKLGRFRMQRLPLRPLLWNAFRPCTCDTAWVNDAASDTDTIETSLFETLSQASLQEETQTCPLSDEIGAAAALDVTSTQQAAADAVSNGNVCISCSKGVEHSSCPLSLNQNVKEARADLKFAEPRVSSILNQNGSTDLEEDSPVQSSTNLRDSALSMFESNLCQSLPEIDQVVVDNELPDRESMDLQDTNQESSTCDGTEDGNTAEFLTEQDSMTRTSTYQCENCNGQIHPESHPSLVSNFLCRNNLDSRNGSWHSSWNPACSTQNSSSCNSLASWASHLSDGFLELDASSIFASEPQVHGSGAASHEAQETQLNGLLFNFARQFQHRRIGGATAAFSPQTQSNNNLSHHSSAAGSVTSHTSEDLYSWLRCATNSSPHEQQQWYFYDPRLTQLNRAQRFTLETNFGGIHNEMSVPGIISPPAYEEIENLPTLPDGSNWVMEPSQGGPDSLEPPPPYVYEPPPPYHSRSNSTSSSAPSNTSSSASSSTNIDNLETESILSDIILENWAMLPQQNDVSNDPNEVIQALLNDLENNETTSRLPTTDELSHIRSVNTVNLPSQHDHNYQHTSTRPANTNHPSDTSTESPTEGQSTAVYVNLPGDQPVSCENGAEASRTPPAVADSNSAEDEPSSSSSSSASQLAADHPVFTFPLDLDQVHFGPTFRMGMRPPIRWNRARNVNRWTSGQGWLPQL